MGTDLNSVGATIRARREALGLSQEQLAHLSGLSRQTLGGLESGKLRDLGYNRVAQLLNIIGLSAPLPSKEARNHKNGLWMAAKTASVSYRNALDPQTLAHTLTTGEVPTQYIAHVSHLLDEAPIAVIVMAVEEAAEWNHVQPKKVWRNVSALANRLNSSRKKELA